MKAENQMKSFKDTNGKEWNIGITIPAVKRVRASLDVNLLELEKGNPSLLTRLGTDLMLLADVTYAIVKPQAEAANIAEEQFFDSLSGEAVRSAQDALYEGLAEFFKGLGRNDVAAAAGMQREVMDRASAEVAKRIQGLDIDAELEKAMGSALAEVDAMLSGTTEPETV